MSTCQLHGEKCQLVKRTGKAMSISSVEDICWITLDDSHRTGATEIVQAIKSVEENTDDSKEMKIWDKIMDL